MTAETLAESGRACPDWVPEADCPPQERGFSARPLDAAQSAMRATADAHGVALMVVAGLAMVFALHWARTFCVSLLLGILLAYTLNPVVARLERMRIARWAAAALVMLAFCGAGVLAAGLLGGQVRAILEQLPDAAEKVSGKLASMRNGEPGTMEKVQTAASQIEKAANQATGTAPRRQAAAVVVEQPGFKLGTFLWANSMTVVAFAGQAIMVMFLVFFLLLSGDTFKRKLVRLTGSSLSKRRITVQVLDDINASIQKFMFMLLATNTLLALLSWLAFLAIGLENAGAWALAAGLLHFVPYAGPALLAVAVGMAAFTQFETFAMALAVACTSLGIAAFVGFIVATWMTGKLARMNTAAVFIALLFWGWLWGAWGLLLAIPIVVIVKVAAEMIEQLHPVAELLRD
jgi:predicted PurR-regulated permease PerM